MARNCSICTHPQNEAINFELLQRVPLNAICSKYGVSTSALQRHKAHIPRQLAKTPGAQEVANSGNIMTRIAELDARTNTIFMQASESQNSGVALRALKELREITQLYARLAGELQSSNVINIVVTPEWLVLRGALLKALAPYPDARRAVVDAIGGVAGA